MKARRRIAFALMLSLLARVALAGEVLLYGPDDMPDPRQVATILGANDGEPEPVRVRSLRLIAEANKDGVQKVKPALQVGRPAPRAIPVSASHAPAAMPYSSFALAVQFSFDSARMSNEMAAQLDAVAEGIRLAGAGVKVVIEGHTDASGSPDYNLYLSLKRAGMVKEYLVRRHGIDPGSLVVMGMGESAPINKKNPFSPENRRVEFRAETA
jgi:outer membrane protein OmpA-like peptidoglycan-associated protein